MNYKINEAGIIAIIQCRTGSKRLPNKALMKIGTKTLIEWVILRTQKSKKITKIVLATSNKKENDALEIIANQYNILTYRGSEDDVVSRYAAICKVHKEERVVRICADNPFIDNKYIDKLISQFDHFKFQYASNHIPQKNRFWGDGFGVEITTRSLILHINSVAESKYEREHLFASLQKLKIRCFFPFTSIYERSMDLKLDIDTYSDYQKICQIIKYNIMVSSSAYQISKKLSRYARKKSR